MTISGEETSALIELVRETAKAEILPRFRQLDHSQISAKTAPDDLVTVADKASEERISKGVEAILPGALIVGEEAASENHLLLDGIATADKCVIIDPIDGTWNYAHGLSTFGVILAVVESGRTVYGLIYDPVLDDWIEAHRGKGAWLCRHDCNPLKLRMGDPSSDLAASSGFVAFQLFPRDKHLTLVEKLTAFRRTMALRCAAHEYRLLVQGHVDFSLNAMLNPWDHAAGALLVEEAGGVARLIDGTDYAPTLRQGRLLLAKSGDQWSALQAHFAPAVG